MFNYEQQFVDARKLTYTILMDGHQTGKGERNAKPLFAQRKSKYCF